jgi:hypothetical protein
MNNDISVSKVLACGTELETASESVRWFESDISELMQHRCPSWPIHNWPTLLLGHHGLLSLEVLLLWRDFSIHQRNVRDWECAVSTVRSTAGEGLVP